VRYGAHEFAWDEGARVCVYDLIKSFVGAMRINATVTPLCRNLPRGYLVGQTLVADCFALAADLAIEWPIESKLVCSRPWIIKSRNLKGIRADDFNFDVGAAEKVNGK
jgi:hypothetical protein